MKVSVFPADLSSVSDKLIRYYNCVILPTELSSVSDKLIRYDVRFEAVSPKLSDKTLSIFLHIDIEVQNDYRPGIRW